MPDRVCADVVRDPEQRFDAIPALLNNDGTGRRLESATATTVSRGSSASGREGAVFVGLTRQSLSTD
jgi:hypothetical protein